MFAELLIERERQGLIDLLSLLAGIDGEVSPPEVAFIAEMKHRLDLDDYEPRAGASIEQVCAAFERKKSKRVALVELIKIAYADSNYDASERAGIRRIAQLMGEDEDVVQELESWVSDGIQWQARGEALLGFQ